MKSATALFAHATTAVAMTSRLSMRRLTCRVFGHRFANNGIAEAPGREKLCSCGEYLLRADGAATHVRHNLACFLGGHSYTKIGERAGHCEYVCSDCGHPMMFERETSPYARRERFRKFVRHRCGWFGHVVHEVTERCGLTEYACHCGHSFLLQAKGLTRVRHPLLCMMTGHRIRLLARRNGQLEFRCRDCGHPFCLAEGANPRRTYSSGLMKRLRHFSVNAAMLFALGAAQTLFLWMFFVAGGLERLAELGHITGPASMNVKATAFDFAARWRHGMTDGWPLYMPGFFVTAIALWRRAVGLSLRRVVAECAVTGALAVIVAWLLAPSGASLALDSFRSETGLSCAGDWPGLTGRVVGQGVFTLISWNSFVLSSQLAIVRKSYRPLLVPAALSVVLILIRPFTVDDFAGLWLHRVWQGAPVAIFSALLIPLLSALLVWILLRSRNRYNEQPTPVQPAAANDCRTPSP